MPTRHAVYSLKGISFIPVNEEQRSETIIIKI